MPGILPRILVGCTINAREVPMACAGIWTEGGGRRALADSPARGGQGRWLRGL